MTVEELILELLNLPLDAELVSFQSNMEQEGIMKKDFYPKLKKFRKEIKNTRDKFDGTMYSYDIYVEDQNGEHEFIQL